MDLRELYQEVILDHNKNPRNFHAMEKPSAQAEGRNPLCGDQLSLYLHLQNNNIIDDVSFTGCGCAISTASASLMTETLKGKTTEEAHALFKQFHDLMMTQDDMAKLGKLSVLAGVRTYPSRVKCATLAWHTLEAALHHAKEPVSTE